MNWTLLLFCIVGFVQNGLPTQHDQDGCPKFRLKRDSIINTSQSLTNGAKFISKTIVQSSKECHRACCEDSTCTMGLMHYEKSKGLSSPHVTKKTCFLFNCKFPSVCVYSSHPDYAAIEFIEPERAIHKLAPTTEKPTKKREGCPPGVPVAMCFANPCEDAECEAFPTATCRPNYCGGCFAHFYDSNDERVNCNKVKTTVHPTESNQAKVNKGKNQKHNNENDADEQETTQPPTEEVHELRQWVDNNPNFPTPNWADWSVESPVSERTKKPTEVKQKEQKTTPVVKTSEAPEVPTSIDIDKKLEKIHEKVWNPPTKVYQECPLFKCSVNCEVFFVDENGCKTCQCVIGKLKKPLKEDRKMNVTLLVESKDVHVVENSAVVPLVIGLIVSIIMLIVVVVRLKSIKGKLRRRPFATDDADYLINGMYL